MTLSGELLWDATWILLNGSSLIDARTARGDARCTAFWIYSHAPCLSFSFSLSPSPVPPALSLSLSRSDPSLIANFPTTKLSSLTRSRCWLAPVRASLLAVPVIYLRSPSSITSSSSKPFCSPTLAGNLLSQPQPPPLPPSPFVTNSHQPHIEQPATLRWFS